jgi:hypothetical protein
MKGKWEKRRLGELKKGMLISWSSINDSSNLRPSELVDIVFDKEGYIRLIVDGNYWFAEEGFWEFIPEATEATEATEDLPAGVYQVLDIDGDPAIYSRRDGEWYDSDGLIKCQPVEILGELPLKAIEK